MPPIIIKGLREIQPDNEQLISEYKNAESIIGHVTYSGNS
jgi:hypothetical protein